MCGQELEGHCVRSHKWQSYQSETKPWRSTICLQSSETGRDQGKDLWKDTKTFCCRDGFQEHCGLHHCDNRKSVEQPEHFLQLVVQQNGGKNLVKRRDQEPKGWALWLSSRDPDCRWENVLEAQSSLQHTTLCDRLDRQRPLWEPFWPSFKASVLEGKQVLHLHNIVPTVKHGGGSTGFFRWNGGSWPRLRGSWF